MRVPEAIMGERLRVSIAVADPALHARVRRVLDAMRARVVRLEGDADVVVADAPGAHARPTVVIAGSQTARDAAAAGAASVLLPDCDERKMAAAIEAVASGLDCFDRELAPLIERGAGAIDGASDGEVLDDEGEDVDAALTPRELEVLELLKSGQSNKHIARALEISVHTAKFHVAQIIGKLGARGRTDAVARALGAPRAMI
jgi:DNA-binding NarL/FixJ family response regulator